MAAKLVAEEGILKGLTLSLEDGDQWVIGRDPDACQLLVEDPSASRKHLICRATPEGILVENLSETNPVQVNEQEVKKPRLLHNGDAVKIGDGTFRFYTEDAAQVIKNEDTELPLNSVETEEHAFINEPNATEIEISNKNDILDTDQTELSQIENDIEPLQDPAIQDPAIQDSAVNDIHDGAVVNENTAVDTAIDPSMDRISGTATADTATNQNQQGIQDLAGDSSIKQKPQQEIKEPNMDPSNITKKTEEDRKDSTTQNFSHQTSLQDDFSEESDGKRHDSIFDEEPSDKYRIAEINFGLLDTGRWLLKVISGPNNGAEFSMQTGSSYIIGTDPNACDIVFHDTSVSRQHTRLTVNPDDTLLLEDLKSRNGTLINGEPLQGKRLFEPNSFVSVGTTSFVVFDREGEMQTIISPLMPSIVKVLQSEEPKTAEPSASPPATEIPIAQEPIKAPEAERSKNFGALFLIAILTGLLLLGAVGTTLLFKNEPVVTTQTIDTSKVLSSALDPFPNVKYSYNSSTGQLLLVGHVLTIGDKNQLLYALRGMPFIKNLDDNGVIIDEYVWREINQVLEKNPDYRGINLMATNPWAFCGVGILANARPSGPTFRISKR